MVNKRCSTSAEAEAADDLNKVTKPLRKVAKRELGDLDVKGKRKKQKKNKEMPNGNNKLSDDDHDDAELETKHKRKKSVRKEIKKLRKSFQELTETMKKLVEAVEEKQKKETPKPMAEPVLKCIADSPDGRNNRASIFVGGFDASLPREEIRSALREHFSSCGEVSCVHVPYECLTGVSLGFAFVDMKGDPSNALTLNGSQLGGRRLEVTMGTKKEEFYIYKNFHGCKQCRYFKMKRTMESFRGRRFRAPFVPKEQYKYKDGVLVEAYKYNKDGVVVEHSKFKKDRVLVELSKYNDDGVLVEEYKFNDDGLQVYP